MVAHDHKEPVVVHIHVVNAFYDVGVGHGLTDVDFQRHCALSPRRVPLDNFLLEDELANFPLFCPFRLDVMDLAVTPAAYQDTDVISGHHQLLVQSEFVFERIVATVRHF